MGLTDRAVFYRDATDFFFCFIPLGGALLIYLVFSFLFDLKGDWINVLAGLIALVLGGVVIYRSCVLNSMNVFVGITVGIAKISLGLFAFLQLFNIVAPEGKTQSQRRSSQAIALVLLTLATMLIFRLVNGERVLAARE